MLVTKTIEIDMGHRVPNHASKCKNFHGHRYKIEVGVNDKVITKMGASNEGMVIDFGDLKEIMMSEIDERFDHGFLMYKYDEFAHEFKQIRDQANMKILFSEFIPTAENLAEYWYKQLDKRLTDRNIKICYVKVWETPTSTATYERKRK